MGWGQHAETTLQGHSCPGAARVSPPGMSPGILVVAEAACGAQGRWGDPRAPRPPVLGT